MARSAQCPSPRSKPGKSFSADVWAKKVKNAFPGFTGPFPRVSVWQGLIGFNQFLLGRYAQAEQATRASVLANPRVPFYSAVLAASLAELGRRDEAAAVLREAAQRHPDYRAARITNYWVGTEPRFVAGRERMVARVVELGLAP